ncbi:hypothetical protein KC19_3G048300 [Ceratodon purpureus]|uniref:Beta-amylase n=1 Tax=Ceratodon purpureus TaxID=3225 RepID=A0A8T0IHI6_CERPU|nr:hypothetical protein KC19_3G048300 [Ceratodon purpureus]
MAISEAEQPESPYSGTPYIPVYVMLPLGTISMDNKLAEPENLRKELETLKSVGTDGVMVDCWWGIVEGTSPLVYDWSAYRQLFTMIRDTTLKLQVVMSFHQCGGNVGDDVFIPLPKWVLNVGRENPDIFFTNRGGVRNPESLSFGIDDEPVLEGRTALEVYYDFMQSFRKELQEFLEDGTITEIEVGLGPCGELRYPSYPETQGWKYPGTGEFQCWDKYLLKSLKNAADMRGHPEWGVGPSDAGHYNCMPDESDFFRGGYKTSYGDFFLTWYSESLIEHGDNVLTVARHALGNMKLAAKVSGIHWWYKTRSHAAELAAGFYNQSSRCGYTPIAKMLATHKAAFNFTCIELRTAEQNTLFPEAQSDPESLVYQVLQAAWAVQGVEVACENALPCYKRSGYDQILAQAKPKGYTKHSLVAFTYLRLTPELLEEQNLREFTRFVHQLHGTSMPSILNEGSC